MKIFGLRSSGVFYFFNNSKFLLLFFIFALWSFGISSQCRIPDCGSGTCGNLNASFAPKGGVEFCDGTVITLNNTSVPGFDYFLVDWRDGSPLDSMANYNDFVHFYYLNDSDLCKGGLGKGFSICFKGVKICSAGFSCATGTNFFTIKYRPKAIISVAAEVCKGSTVAFTNSSCNALTCEWIFGDNTTSTNCNPTKVFNTPGTYTVTLKVQNDCGRDSTTRTITVVDQPLADFSYSSASGNFCGPTTVSFVNKANQWSGTRWRITPADTSKWMFTDTLMSLGSKNIGINFKKTGTYFVELEASNACGKHIKKDTIIIYEPPIINIKTPPPSCDKVTITPSSLGFTFSGAITSFRWVFTNGTPSNGMGSSFPPVVFTQSGSITLTITSPCGDTTISVQVVVATTDPIVFQNIPDSLCKNVDSVQLKVTPIGGTWTGLGAASQAINSLGVLKPGLLNPGTYLFVYSIGAQDCPNKDTVQIIILEPLFVKIDPQDTVCNQLSFTPKVNFKGDIINYLWSFAGAIPATSSLKSPSGIQYSSPGKYLVICSIDGPCGIMSDSIYVVIEDPPMIIIDSIMKVICSSSAPFNLKATPMGGVWSGPGIIDSNTGLFDPSKVSPGQSHVVTYTYNKGSCMAESTITINVTRSQSLNVQDEILCIDGVSAVLMADQTGGVWKGIGVVDSLQGIFNPDSSGVGDFKISYYWMDSSGCNIQALANVKVEALPVIRLDDTAVLCVTNNDIDLIKLLNFKVDSIGGNSLWQGQGIVQNKSIFNAGLANLGPGFYKVFVSYQHNKCIVTDSAVIELVINSPLQLSPDTVICISELILQLSANLIGGKWSGAGIDSLTGIIQLAIAGGGTHKYEYVFSEGNSCEQRKSVNVEIIDLSSLVKAGPDIEICEGVTNYTLAGATPGGGVWRGIGIIDSLNGIIDLSFIQMDSTYVYQYCIESNKTKACAACSSRKFTVHSKPIINISILGKPCINEEFELINNTSNAQSYLWDFGDNTTSIEQNPKHTYTQGGNYILTLNATSAFGCIETFSQVLFVTTPPVVDFSIPIKEGCAPFQLNITNKSSGFNINQLWCINGDTISGASPGNIYLDHITKDSLFQILLKVTNVCGTVIDSETVLVHPYPIVDFGFNVDEGCSPLLIDFANTTLGNPETFFWNMGNGNSYIDSIPPPQYYTTTDTLISIYKVTLISTNICGADTLEKYITVYPPNVKAFIQLDTLKGCQPFVFNPKSFSTPGARLSWEVYDSQNKLLLSSNQTNPIFLLNQSGIFKIILNASNCGTDSDTAFIEVLPSPKVDFTHDPFVCQGEEILFLNRSQNVSTNFWEFGDSTSSTDISPTHRYTMPGKFIVTLTSTSSLNNCPASDTSEITVIGKPISSFTADTTSGCAPLLINFTNNSSGQSALNYLWDFNDGTSFSFAKDTSHIFYKPGNYQVRLTVYDQFNCFSDTSIFNILVHGLPISNINANKLDYCFGNDTVVLINASVDAVSYIWKIGNKEFFTKDINFVPDTFGKLNVELIVENVFQCKDTAEISLNIKPSPISKFDLDKNSGCEDLEVHFLNESNYGAFFIWNFGDQTTATDKDVIHNYMSPGTHAVSLIVISNNGCPSDTAYSSVVVYPKPQASFSLMKTNDCGAPSNINFTNSSNGGKDYSWNFGDGAFSDLQNPSHVYDTIGDFTITHVVSNEYLCADTVSKVVNIYGNPFADFDISAIVGCEDLEVDLMNKSDQSITYLWNIESIGLSELDSPHIVFKDPGKYDISLIAIYNDICRDTLFLQSAVTVYKSPIAKFRYQADNNANIIGDVLFTNVSQYSDRYLWNFGDGTNSTASDSTVFHEYSINRSIKVLLIAYNENMGQYTCLDTSEMDINPEWIKTFYAPNAFTPDYGNGYNVFKPVGIGLVAYEISVYSPWGEQVWYSTSLEEGHPKESWDGKYKGEIVPQGSYVWIAKMRFVDGTDRIVRGNVTAIR